MDEYILFALFFIAFGTGIYYLIKYIDKPTTEPVSQRRGEAVKNWFKRTF